MSAALGLGIDAGGTQTRWALADAHGQLLAEGEVAGLSALQMSSSDGRAQVQATFDALAAAVRAHGQPQRIEAGLTGFGGDGGQLSAWLAARFGLDGAAVGLRNDIEFAYLDNFRPGQGYLVYAGTGSIAAYIDGAGQFHRAGGRGVLLDDGGGGFWIAREALRCIWRREDEDPGAWRTSALARAVFEQLGDSDWAASRQFIYGQERGAIGKLALVVAACADRDPDAARILHEAGLELARLGRALSQRFGPRPLVVAGRAASLHPCIVAAMRSALPGTDLRQVIGHAHHAAARLAARIA
ncbi:BadF/BadG/BcrA/BcrD ATPase family protein [Massilia sp. TS11]|uniref:BadF/BadG/BcrA/BcrD ATPase family protein n=1 Tax=Massilia sp. TS11 TaxID=2908003 RepID=UPI001EDA3193|nr:BadF/BadG/BcrA/BcrD ATPase family protein [Massilia sp. TS11]MCG2585158.1 ATPase [Massilia sp. TS11]